MSDEERAAKAARAKAMLNKRRQQQAKKPSNSVTSDNAGGTPGSPLSRTASPAVVDVAEDKIDFGDVFGKSSLKVDPNTNWLNSLERVGSPSQGPESVTPPPVREPSVSSSTTTTPILAAPQPRSPATPGFTGLLSSSSDRSSPAESKGISEETRAVQARVQVLEGNISRLVSSEANLKASLKELQDAKTFLNKENQSLLVENSRLQLLEGRIHQLAESESDFNTSLRVASDERTLLVGENRDLRAEVDKHQQRATDAESSAARSKRELSESIDRIELELSRAKAELSTERQSLSSWRDRVGSLEQEVQSAADHISELTAQERSSSAALTEARTALEELRSQHASHQQTISLLVSEKAELTSSLEDYRSLESDLTEARSALHTERTNVVNYQAQVRQLEEIAAMSRVQIADFQSQGKDAADKLRELERDLQLSRSELNELKPQLEHHRRRATEFQEQNDDRVERLEQSLQNTQARADELEFQLNKVKQASEKLREEYEKVNTELEQGKTSRNSLQADHVKLQTAHSQVTASLNATVVEKDRHLHDVTNLQKDLLDTQSSLSQLRQQFTDITAELNTRLNQLKTSQVELHAANLRVEEAEKLQKDIQTEGSGLIKSLERARTKVAELTATNTTLISTVDRLETALRERDAAIADLENSGEEIRHKLEDTQTDHQDRISSLQKEYEKDRHAAEQSNADLQKAYFEAENELKSLRSATGAFEVERSDFREKLHEHGLQLSRLTSDLRNRTLELQAVQAELEERRHVYEEDQQVLAQAQADLEFAYTELAGKDEELANLQEEKSRHGPKQSISLNEEIASALQQEHSLELSEAQSEIRRLETSLYNAEAKAHSLQKEVQDMQDEVLRLQSTPLPPDVMAVSLVSVPSRPPSRGFNRPEYARTASGTQRQPTGGVSSQSSNRTLLDLSLSPETWHKRRVSLGMLKARIDSEMNASKHIMTSWPAPRPLSPSNKHIPTLASVSEPLESLGIVMEPSKLSHLSVRSHYSRLDEAHVFWCHCCEGDLVVI